jgi:type II secretory ATPase GspE/PulE/Tfp pilus assembly ATPase PilB-like protein
MPPSGNSFGSDSETAVPAPTPASASKPDWTTQINAELAFRLIDSILPFEACLFHQVLPMALEGSRLRLGMVLPDDSAALDYVRRILAYMNCSLVVQSISSDLHHSVLTAYLNYASTKTQPPPPRTRKLAAPKSKPVNERATLLLEAEDVRPLDTAPPPPASTASAAAGQLAIDPSDLVPAVAGSSTEANAAQAVASLVALPPVALLDELLTRMLKGGIGRLYFERHEPHGRILWSQDGVMQAVLEQVSLATYDGAIAALKAMAQLPATPVSQSQYVELDHQHNNVNLLLRLRLLPGAHGEEANLQVLRGAALRFHRQQQMTQLAQDALATAQTLQRQVNDIRERMQVSAVATPEQQAILPTLCDLLAGIQQQVHSIQGMTSETANHDG